MRAVLDACVLYPTVMRELLVGAAQAGLYEARWSARIIEEWVRAAGRDGAEAEARERLVAESLNARIPQGMASMPQGLEQRLWLPDPADVHVLACAIGCSADVIVTMNARDFPRNVLAEEGLSRADPDGLLLGFAEAEPELMAALAEEVRARAARGTGQDWTLRALMKKARLPRLGKALERQAQGRGL